MYGQTEKKCEGEQKTQLVKQTFCKALSGDAVSQGT